jgi:hypothetical protein
MRFTLLAVVLLLFAIVFSLAVTKPDLVTPKTESSFVKFNLKDLSEHGNRPDLFVTSALAGFQSQRRFGTFGASHSRSARSEESVSRLQRL